MEPFEHEARRLLGEALAKSDYHRARQVRTAAAEQLLKDFVDLARAQGLEAGQVQDASAFFVAASSSYSVRLNTDGETFMLQRFQYQYVGKPREARFVFDCVTNTFSSADVDPDIAPTPGQRLPRVHPLVVMARLAAELLASSEE